MKISIITVNYNNAADTIGLINSLEDQTDGDFDAYIVDNGSDRTDADKLDKFMQWTDNPRFSFIQNTRNLGFSGGNNTAIKLALLNGSEWVFLLNNDTSLDSSFIERLRANLSVSEGGIIGIPLDESGHTAYCGKILWRKLTLPHIYRQVKAKKLLLKRRAYAIGGAMLIHRNVIETIGFLDERYFLYFEDADYSARALKAGFDIDIFEDDKIKHKVSASTKKIKSPRLLRYHIRNAHLFTVKNAPWYVRLIVPFWSLWLIAKQLIKMIILPHKLKYSKAILSGIFDYYFNRFGIIE